ncbi:hypothetical protein DFH06DRAFT_1465341 [Mycena polygramma]|nr:hypothetical protein DFH06DRAFT_1465341 [Mycena polygramma]
MPLVVEDDIDAYGLDEFSADFLTELDKAEETFPSSFCPPPPNTVQEIADDDEYDSMFLEPCSQEMSQALDEMERPDFVPIQSSSQPTMQRDPSPSVLCGQLRPPASTAPALFGNNTWGRSSDSTSSTCPTLVSRYGMRYFFLAGLIVHNSDSVKSEPSSPPAPKSSPPSSPCPVKTSPSRKRARSIVDSDSDDEVDSKKAKPAPPTHLSQFFAAYPKYEYDPAGPASQQFHKLRRIYKFNNKASNEAYDGYNRALGLTFSQEYGDDVDSLENWQGLCRAVEIVPIPETLEECEYAIEDSHVNLIDLVDLTTTRERVHRFKTEGALSVYTKKTGKFFPRKRVYKGPLLRHLLRRILNPPPENLMRRGGRWVEREA